MAFSKLVMLLHAYEVDPSMSQWSHVLSQQNIILKEAWISPTGVLARLGIIESNLATASFVCLKENAYLVLEWFILWIQQMPIRTASRNACGHLKVLGVLGTFIGQSIPRVGGVGNMGRNHDSYSLETTFIGVGDALDSKTRFVRRILRKGKRVR